MGRSIAVVAALLIQKEMQAEKLSGREDLFRVRVGDYRVIYSVHDDELLVLVVKIGHRGKVYRGH